MSNTVIQIKRSQTTAIPASLAEGELAYSGNGVSNSLFIGLPDGGNTVTRIAGGKYGFLHSANTGNSTVAVIEGGTLTANSVLISDANSSIDELRTAKLIINTSGNTVNEVTSVSVFANTTQLGANAGGSNVEIVTSSAIKTYVDGKTAAIGGALANQQVAFSNGSVFQGSAAFTFDYGTNSLSVSNTVIVGTSTTINASAVSATNVIVTSANVANNIDVGSNVSISTSTIVIGNSTVNTSITSSDISTTGTLLVSNLATFSNGITLSNTVISNVADPVNPKDATNKQYVDEVAEGLRVKPAVEIATTASLTANYDNGTSGVGATLTATANGAFPQIDGVTLSSTTPGQNGVLVKNQANSAHNGRYNLTTVGDTNNPWVLTRCGLCDESDEIAGMYVFVKDGTLYTGTGWVAIVNDPATFTIGTDAISYVQFSGAGTFTAGDYLFLDGTEFNVNATSSSVASVVVARDASENFSANVVTVNSIAAGNGEFTGPVSGITTLAAGNTTITGYANITSTLAAGNTVVSGTLTANDTTIVGYANVTSTLAAGNTTVTGFINVSSTAALGNTTVTGFANISSTLAAGNTTITGTLASGNTTITGFANVTSTLAAGNTTVTGFINVSSTADIVGALTVTNTAALGNTTVTGFANISSTLAAGNTTVTGFINVSSSADITGPLSVTNTAGLGNTTITGFANISGDLTVSGNSVIGSDNSDRLSVNALLSSNVIPAANLTYLLGNSSSRFAEVYSGNVVATTGSFVDVTVTGNLTVEGTLTTIDTDNLVVEDPLIKVARNNDTDAVDIGIFGQYANTPTLFSGIFRDASDSGVWKFFKDLEVAPTTTIDTANNTYSIATVEAYLRSGGLTTNSTAVAITANSSVSVSITANTFAANVVTVTGSSNNDIFFANGSGALVALSLGADGTVLQSNGTAVVYGGLDGGTF